MLSNNLDKIDLSVDIEVCKVNLTLEKLLQLQPGDVLTTNVIPAAVKLVVNGQTIADGFLVDLNGQTGVRITKLYAYANTVASASLLAPDSDASFLETENHNLEEDDLDEFEEYEVDPLEDENRY